MDLTLRCRKLGALRLIWLMIKDGDSGKSVFKAGVFRQFGAQVRRPEQLNPHQRAGVAVSLST